MDVERCRWYGMPRGEPHRESASPAGYLYELRTFGADGSMYAVQIRDR